MYSHHLSAAEANARRDRFIDEAQAARLHRAVQAARAQARVVRRARAAQAAPGPVDMRAGSRTPVVLRAARPGDRHALARMVSELSPRSSFLRFCTGGVRVTPRVLDALLCLRGSGRAFVAVEGERVVAHAMWATTRADDCRAEIAFMVAADRRGRGLATRVTSLVLADAAARGLSSVEATVLVENSAAQRVVRRVLPAARSTRSHGEISYSSLLGDSDVGGGDAGRTLLSGAPCG